MNRTHPVINPSSADQLARKVAAFGDWRGIVLTRVRELIKA
ncbi:hypothetical protein [Gynuella sp.]